MRCCLCDEGLSGLPESIEPPQRQPSPVEFVESLIPRISFFCWPLPRGGHLYFRHALHLQVLLFLAPSFWLSRLYLPVLPSFQRAHCSSRAYSCWPGFHYFGTHIMTGPLNTYGTINLAGRLFFLLVRLYYWPGPLPFAAHNISCRSLFPAGRLFLLTLFLFSARAFKVVRLLLPICS